MKGRSDGGPNASSFQMLTADEVLAMQFYSFEAAESLYHEYSLAVGFVVRSDAIVRNKQGEIITRRWVCNRENNYLENVDSHGDPRPETRTTCPAAFCISLDHVSHRWFVREFVAEHTHELAPTSRLHHHLPEPVMIPNTDNDVEIVLAYLKGKKDADPGLFYDVKSNEGCFASLFLADSMSQFHCACFGDVVAVYRTKMIDKHFVILAGLNHHHQAIVFGCAILRDETVESYSWLFRSFLHVSQGCMPITVVTDGDGDNALCEAIKHVLPRSRHRLCTWQLEKLARSNLNVPFFIRDFEVFMLEPLLPDDFELRWKGMVDRYKLSENPWIHKMYENRHEWAETYFRGHFLAGLRSTEVCENIGSHLSWFSYHKPWELINQYKMAVDEIRYNEMMDEHESKNVKFAPSTTLVKIEKHAADVFTRESYQRFLSEMQLETLLFVLRKDEGSNCHKYKLGMYEHPNLAYEVMFKPSGPSIKCTCLKFETLGFPCCHAIHVMKSEGLREIPQNLIHPRWTKEAMSSAQFWQRHAPAVSADVIVQMMRFGTLTSLFSSLTYFAMRSDKVYDEVLSSCQKLFEEYKHSDNSEKDDTPVSQIARLKASQRAREDERRKTQGAGHSGNVEQIRHAVIRAGDSSLLVRRSGRLTSPHFDH